jgi:hypothetical integral membrane protein (TIGR02206 family)
MLERYFSKIWLGYPFEIFNLPHLIALAGVACACMLVFGLRRHFTPTSKRIFRRILAGILLFSQTSFILWLIYIREFSFTTALPLHMCSLFIVLSAFMLLFRSYKIYEFSYFLGTGGAVYALITPDIGFYNFPHFLPVQTMIAHGCLLLAQIYMTAVEGFRPDWRSLRKVYLGVLIYSTIVIVINTIIGSNYLFFAFKPDFPSLLDYMGPWPWYILGIQFIGAATCFLLYLPFYWQDRRSAAMHLENQSDRGNSVRFIRQ